MRKINLSHKMRPLAGAAFALLLLGAGSSALADPVVSSVPWVATNPLIPHDIFSGESTRLKGTASDVDAGTLTYTWDFGDGSPVASGTVTNQYVVEANHTYTGVTGTVITATLTVKNGSTNKTGSANYFVQIQDKNLDSEVNVAIDEGLWYLHKTQTKLTISGLPGGYWPGSGVGNTTPSNTGQNVSAFLVNGHLPNGSADNPYTETVQRGMRRMFNTLGITPSIPSTETNPEGTFNPDANGNGCAVFASAGGNPFYQSGMVMDAIVASGLQNEVVDVAPFTITNCSGPGQTNNGSWTYADVVQDYTDYLSWCQYDGVQGGGWRYSCESFPDGSVVQWAAVGLIAAERNFGTDVPQPVKDHLKTWTDFAHNAATGVSGYTSQNPIWGPYATTPSGTVQMVYNGQGRGNSLWDTSESFQRANWCNGGTTAGTNIKYYYYGLFSFAKSMLLHDADGDGVSEPLDCLGPANDIDWYAGETGQASSCNVSEPCNGVARSLVNDQNASGYWPGRNYWSTQNPYSTGWAIVMLNRTVFSSGLPVAVAQATPNPAVAGQTIVLDGSGSFHQDASKSIDSWEWDLDNDGVFDATGPTVSTSFPAIGNYPVTLRVTDDATPEEADDTTVLTILITTPPIAPTANADGPYVFCPQAQPWFMDGTGSVNPDEGVSEPGQPGDTIQTYAWELNGDNAFDDAFGPQPDVTAFFTAAGTGDYLVQLKVTDTTATSFPNSGFGDLSDTDTAQVSVKDAADAACACIDDLAARAKDGKVQLTWTDTGPNHYNVYRSTTAGGPYVFVASTTSTYSTYLDTGLTNGTTYYYVVREAALNGDELCQSNEASATPVARVRRR